MTTWKIISIFALVGANAFFVAAELSLVAVRPSRIQELVSHGSRRAASAQKARSQLPLILSGTQLGITFASLGLGAIGEPTLAELVAGAFKRLPHPIDLIATHGAAVVLAFAAITILHVVIGELVPKNAAINNAEQTALWTAGPMRIFTFSFRPVIWFLERTSQFILGLFKMKMSEEFASLHTTDELAIIIEESRRGGALERSHSEILTRTLEFPDKRAVEAMIARTSVTAIPADATIEDALETAEETGFSRFPVWRERPDEFIGVVHLKDLVKAARDDSKDDVRAVMRDPLLIHESLPLEDVLIMMRRDRNHFAIVLDEFGATAGILTLEDIIEELVGEIRDEYDTNQLDVRAVEGGFRVPGTMRPDELFDATGCQLPEGEYETVAGFILDRLGRLARRGDEISVHGYRIRVANVRRRRIVSVDVQVPAA